MLQWYKSNRCLITVLIAGHRAAHAHIFTVTSNVGDDNSSTTFTFLRSLSHHFMGELPAMNNSNTSMPRAGVYLEMHAHTTATNSPIFHLTVQDLRESWSCKLWKDLFFPTPDLLEKSTQTLLPFFFLQQNGRDHSLRDNWWHLETITWSFSSWPGSRLRYTNIQWSSLHVSLQQ